jgi:hypothetical protein
MWLRQLQWLGRQASDFLEADENSERPAEDERREAGGLSSVPEPVSAAMQRLLLRSLEQTTAGGRQELFRALLDQLVPDEARIIAALGNGTVSPLVDVYVRSGLGKGATPLLENASLIGRTAAVAVPRLTPVYIGHLRNLGLLEIGPEDSALAREYEVLMAENVVRKALDHAEGLLPPRVLRRTLRLSRLGRELWETAKPADPELEAPP